MQSILCHSATILCAEDSSSSIYESVLSSTQQVILPFNPQSQLLAALHNQVAVYSAANVKTTTSRVNDSIREKAPKSLSDSVYACVYWSLLQDLIGRITEQHAAWTSNGGDFDAVALPPVLCAELLTAALQRDDSVLLQRVEFASLFQYLVR